MANMTMNLIASGPQVIAMPYILHRTFGLTRSCKAANRRKIPCHD